MRPEELSSPDRRDFLRVAAAMSAGGGLAGVLTGQDRRPRAAQDKPQPTGIGNEVPPALAFQSPLGGHGTFAAERGEAQTAPIAIAKWTGERPSDDDLAFLPAHRLAALLQAKRVTSLELTNLFLARLKKYDPKLHFVVNRLEDRARKEAEDRDAELAAGKSRGPLHGIPYGIKDLFAAKGAPTTWGAKPFEQRVIDRDATVVKRLRAAGAVLIAKLTTGALARGDRWFGGKTRNPWNPEQGSSGSSAGPGAATAAGCVPFAVGTETLGSIVSPARRNGISALRPTFGRVSRGGCMSLAFSMDKVGPMGRNAMDCALVFAAIHGADPADPATISASFAFDPEIDLAKLRIGYDTRTSKATLAVLEKLGAKPRPIGKRPGSGRRRRGGGMIGVLTLESALAFHDFLLNNEDAKMVVKDRTGGWRNAMQMSALDYLNEQRRRYQLMQQMDEFMRDWDLYLSSTGDLFLTNSTGHPTAVMQHAFARNQPQSTMLIGGLFRDDVLLSVAHRFQTQTDWHERRPQLG